MKTCKAKRITSKALLGVPLSALALTLAAAAAILVKGVGHIPPIIVMTPNTITGHTSHDVTGLAGVISRPRNMCVQNRKMYAKVSEAPTTAMIIYGTPS